MKYPLFHLGSQFLSLQGLASSSLTAAPRQKCATGRRFVLSASLRFFSASGLSRRPCHPQRLLKAVFLRLCRERPSWLTPPNNRPPPSLTMRTLPPATF